MITEQEEQKLQDASDTYEEALEKIKALQKEADDALKAVLQPLVKQYKDDLDSMTRIGFLMPHEFTHSPTIYRRILQLQNQAKSIDKKQDSSTTES